MENVQWSAKWHYLKMRIIHLVRKQNCFRKIVIPYPLIRTCSYVYQGWEISFSKNFAYVLNWWSQIKVCNLHQHSACCYFISFNLRITRKKSLIICSNATCNTFMVYDRITITKVYNVSVVELPLIFYIDLFIFTFFHNRLIINRLYANVKKIKLTIWHIDSSINKWKRN